MPDFDDISTDLDEDLLSENEDILADDEDLFGELDPDDLEDPDEITGGDLMDDQDLF